MSRLPLLTVLLLAAAGCAPEDSSPADMRADDVPAEAEPFVPDVDAAVAVVREFHSALTAADSARVLDLLHPDAVIYEAGHAETVEQYRTGHLAADIEFAGGVEREIAAEEAVPVGDALLYTAETRTAGTFRGRELDVSGAETVVLVLEEEDWRIRHIHWSSH